MKDKEEYIKELSINKNYSENTIEAYKRDLDEYFLYLKKYMDVDFGEDIQELKNKNLIVYGYKNSGKTTLIRKLLSKLNNFKIFVFSVALKRAGL
mgnify:CR=1 FL=1